MTATFVKSAFRLEDMPTAEKPQVAMVGRSNVGKSSLINHLAGTKNLARVSAQPGLTQSMNFYDFDGRFFLVDLPGYGYSKASRSRGKGFEEMLSQYLFEVESLKLALVVIDARLGATESDAHVLEQLRSNEVPSVIVFNKTDKLSNSAVAMGIKKLRAAYPDIPCIAHSTDESAGLGEIRDAIEKAVRATKS